MLLTPRGAKICKNGAVKTGTNLESLKSETILYIAEKFDHNIRTLDGNYTFNGMGITPATKKTRVVPRKTINHKDISDARKSDKQYLKIERFDFSDIHDTV